MQQRTLLLVFCLLPLLGFAEENEEEEQKLPNELENITLPNFPSAGSPTYTFPVDSTNDFIFSIDANSLTIDADEIIRYTVMLTSASGAQNVFYEAIRCITREYKIYGYGTNHSQHFQKKREVEWRPIHLNERGVMRYRNALYTHYFCDRYTRNPFPQFKVIRNLKLGVEASIFKYVD